MIDETVVVYDTKTQTWRVIPEDDLPAWKALGTIKEMIKSDQPLDLERFEELVGLVGQSGFPEELVDLSS